ncbi:MAG: hypothetical protein AAF192_03955 [Pseudomonadota bacterium]
MQTGDPDPLATLNDAFVRLADARLRLISVFDDLRYDRADADILSVAMRRHAVQALARAGFRQTSGSVLTRAADGARCLMPKFHALGASPFDAMRYTPRREADFCLLTPTQTAAALIDAYAPDQAAARIAELMESQPVNLYRLLDFLESKPDHDAFRRAFRSLEARQAELIAAGPLSRRRALG